MNELCTLLHSYIYRYVAIDIIPGYVINDYIARQKITLNLAQCDQLDNYNYLVSFTVIVMSYSFITYSYYFFTQEIYPAS